VIYSYQRKALRGDLELTSFTLNHAMDMLIIIMHVDKILFIDHNTKMSKFQLLPHFDMGIFKMCIIEEIYKCSNKEQMFYWLYDHLFSLHLCVCVV
jgi:hypothetical protein